MILLQVNNMTSKELEANISPKALEEHLKWELTCQLSQQLYGIADMTWTEDPYANATKRTLEVVVVPPRNYRRIRHLMKQLFAESNDLRVRELIQLIEFPETIQNNGKNGSL